MRTHKCVFVFVFVSVCVCVREKKPSARGVIRPQEEADVQPCGCVRRLIIATAHFQVFVLPFGMFIFHPNSLCYFSEKILEIWRFVGWSKSCKNLVIDSPDLFKIFQIGSM